MQLIISRKRKTKEKVTGLTSRGSVTFSRKSIFLQDSKICSFTFAFSKFLTKKKMIETTLLINSCRVKKALFLLPIGNANLPNYFCLIFSFIRKMPLFYLRFSFITNWASLQIIFMDFIQFLVSLLCRQRRLGKLPINLSRQIQVISSRLTNSGHFKNIWVCSVNFEYVLQTWLPSAPP